MLYEYKRRIYNKKHKNWESELLKYISQFKVITGRMPSYKEIVMDLDINISVLNRCLNRLHKKRRLIRVVRGIPFEVRI